MLIESLESRTLLSSNPAISAADSTAPYDSQITLDAQVRGNTFIPSVAGPPADLILDPSRKQLLVVDQSQDIRRYSAEDGRSLGAIHLPAIPGDGDITPDGQYLYLPKVGSTDVFKVNLDTGDYTLIGVGYQSNEGLPAHIAILDGVAIVSQDPQIPYNLDRLRRINLSDDSVADLWLGNYGPLYFPEPASLARSADRTHVSIVSASNDYYFDTGGGMDGRNLRSNGALPTISVSRNGDLYSLAPDTRVLDRQFQVVHQFSGGIGVFDPQRDVFYLVNRHYLEAYSTTTWSKLWDLQTDVFDSGIISLAISDDGGSLFCATQDGVRILHLGATRETFGNTLVVHATVDPIDFNDVPTGSVTFIDGTSGEVLGESTLSGSNEVWFGLDNLRPGTHSIVARYNGDLWYNASTSDPLPFLVDRAPTLSILSSTATGLPRLTVTSSADTPIDGTAELLEGSDVVATSTVSNGMATFAVDLPAGVHNLTARYDGNADLLSSVSGPMQSVIQSPSKLTLSSSDSSISYGSSLVLTATLDTATLPSGANCAFYDGVKLLGVAPIGPAGTALLKKFTLSAGTHQLQAHFDGTETIAASISQLLDETVTKAATTVVIVPLADSGVGQTIRLAATVSSPGGIVNEGIVDFKTNDKVLGGEFVVSGQSFIQTSGLEAGLNKITAVFGGSDNFAPSIAEPVTANVVAGLTTLKLISSVDYAFKGDRITLEADLNAPGDATPSGSIIFKDGTRIIGTEPLSFGRAILEIKLLKAGSHVITATYSGDVDFKSAKSNTVKPTIVVPVSVDVMIVYTKHAIQAARGLDDLKKIIADSVRDANSAYRNSRIPLMINLVYSGRIDYVESGKFDIDLKRLTRPDDGYMDSVHSLRNTYGADLVSLFEGDGDLGGSGWELRDLHDKTNAAFGFSVVLAGQAAAPYYTLAHELGHNFGATHDAQHREGKGVTTFSNGWRFTGNDGVLYHDIMSYDPGETIPYFSNPRIKYEGKPTGNAKTADSARTITMTAPYVAAYRKSRRTSHS